jgi:hypothetical protein
MGTVWLAERADGQLKRRCALKLPAFAWSDALRERMAQERDILASLDHPHIARLLDAGADEQGRPFLALEHVQGEAIDRWADRKLLPVRARVELFVQVVDAIRYAHANLVIHRDLKPSNILVTDAGQCKLLDFGIAKLMSDAQAAEQAAAPPDLTLTGQRLLTPRYASPEQVLGQRLTAASDVYSLGVVLYELLCGSTPYEAGDSARPLLEQAILDGHVRAASRQPEDGEAARLRGTTPQRLARQLRGELDAILLRALGRQPQDRYPSAEALQADLLAWLGNRPIQARKPGVLATAWKFVRRHRWPVAIGTAGVVATAAMALVAAGMAWRSEREAQSATAARDFMSNMLRGTDPLLRQGREPKLRELLERAEADIEEKYRGQPRLREQVYREVAELWARFGEHARRVAALEKRAQALAQLGDKRALATNLLEQARVALDLLNDIEGATRLLDRFQDIAREHPVPAHELFDHALWRGWIASDKLSNAEALAAFSRAEVQARAIGRPYPLALALRGKALIHRRFKSWEQANSTLLAAWALVSDLSLNWDPVERRAVRWELAQEALRQGYLQRGWREVQELMSDDETQRGKFNLSSMGDQMLWLRYCIAMRQEQVAKAWLVERRKVYQQGSPPPANANWLLLEALVFGLTGDNGIAEQALQEATATATAWPPGLALSNWRVSFASTRARLAVQTRNQELLDRSLSELAIHVASLQAHGADPATYAMLAKYRALAERMRNAGHAPIIALREAQAELESNFGPTHPDVLAMRLNLALQKWESSPEPNHANEVLAAAQALQAVVPAGHPVMQVTTELTLAFGRPEIKGAKPPQDKSALTRAQLLMIL